MELDTEANINELTKNMFDQDDSDILNEIVSLPGPSPRIQPQVLYPNLNDTIISEPSAPLTPSPQQVQKQSATSAIKTTEFKKRLTDLKAQYSAQKVKKLNDVLGTGLQNVVFVLMGSHVLKTSLKAPSLVRRISEFIDMTSDERVAFVRQFQGSGVTGEEIGINILYFCTNK